MLLYYTGFHASRNMMLFSAANSGFIQMRFISFCNKYLNSFIFSSYITYYRVFFTRIALIMNDLVSILKIVYIFINISYL